MATAKRPSGSAAKPGGKETPFLRFRHSEALREKTLAVLAALEAAPDPVAHRSDLAVELTDAGLDAFFMGPLKAAGTGFLTRRSADLGLAGAARVIGAAIRGIIGRMDAPQLRSVCGSIREFMR